MRGVYAKSRRPVNRRFSTAQTTDPTAVFGMSARAAERSVARIAGIFWTVRISLYRMVKQIAERNDLLPKLAQLFRRHGYEGTSLAAIAAGTGLGKGSLYHFFPRGKPEMAQAVLDETAAWFAREVLGPLRHPGPPRVAIREMCRALEAHHKGGTQICAFALFAADETQTLFAAPLRAHFQQWIEALARVLVLAGRGPAAARTEAFDAVATVQGAIVLARAAEDGRVFAGAVARLEARLCA
jgi:AcrR family transcriptional regulator